MSSTYEHSKYLFTLFLALIFVASSGCRGVTDFDKGKKIEHYMNSWIGHYQLELIGEWGPPTSIVPDKSGGQILTYESLKGLWGESKDVRVVGGLHYPTGKRQQGYAAKRIFYVNKENIIYKVDWSGL